MAHLPATGVVPHSSPPFATSGDELVAENNRLLSLAFESARDMMLVARVETGPIFRIVAVNRQYLDTLNGAGFAAKRSDLVGRTFDELRSLFNYPEAEWAAILERYASVVRSRHRLRFDEVTATPAGVFYGDSTITPVCDESGQCIMVLYASSNVTDRKRAEAALKESEEKFSKAFHASPGAMALSEPDGRGFIEVNDGYVKMFGYSREELLGRRSWDLGLWAGPDQGTAFIREFRERGRVRDMEVTRRRRDGTEIICLISAEAVMLGGRQCMVTALSDITERKRAEQALRESEQRFATAFHASPGAMGIADAATQRFVEVNDGYCRMFGYAREEFVGRTTVDLGLWADLEQRAQFFAEFQRQGFVREFEARGRRKDGRLMIGLLSAEKVEVGGKPHFVTAIYDITERRQAEQERGELEAQLRQTQKLEALGQLAGGIAHDFNNILTGIIAYAELAAMDAERPKEVRAHLAAVRRASDRAADLVRQILTFSRKQRQERKPIALGPVVKEAVKLLRSTLPKTIEIVEEVGAIPVVLADATQIHQVIMNLCTNAAHALRDGRGTVSILLEDVRVARDGPRPANVAEGRYARLRVSDTGHGMDAQTLERIFEPFFTTKAPGEGTGLGLAVVHGIVEDHDGAIFVQSKVGEGTTVDIYLPEHAAIDRIETGPGAEIPRGEGERVLLIDDETTIIRAATELLQRIGYVVTAHSDPRLAWSAFAEAPENFDVIVTDLTMPHLTGLELARRILAVRPAVPIVLATGQPGALTAEQLAKLGVRGFLTKPLTSMKLARAVREALTSGGGGRK